MIFIGEKIGFFEAIKKRNKIDIIVIIFVFNNITIISISLNDPVSIIPNIGSCLMINGLGDSLSIVVVDIGRVC